VNDLELSDREKKRLRCLVGKRYNSGKNEITLTTSRFLNRGHNMQYLVYLLENLVAEAKGETHIQVSGDAKGFIDELKTHSALEV